MTALSPGMGWDAALEQLTALPGEHQPVHGAANFMRAGVYRRNGRRLFDEAIAPLLGEGRSFEVVLGFVAQDIASELKLGEDDGYCIGSDEFLAARLRDVSTGELVHVAISALT